jgi:hypothetical protein
VMELLLQAEGAYLHAGDRRRGGGVHGPVQVLAVVLDAAPRGGGTVPSPWSPTPVATAAATSVACFSPMVPLLSDRGRTLPVSWPADNV